MRTRTIAALVGGLIAGAYPLAAQSPPPPKTKNQTTTTTKPTGTNKTGGSAKSGGTAKGSGSIAKSWVDTGSKVPNLNANANAVALQHIMVEHEGFEIDTPAVSTKPRKKSSIGSPANTTYHGPILGQPSPAPDTNQKKSP